MSRNNIIVHDVTLDINKCREHVYIGVVFILLFTNSDGEYTQFINMYLIFLIAVSYEDFSIYFELKCLSNTR